MDKDKGGNKAGQKSRKRGLSIVSKRFASDGDESDVSKNRESSKQDLESKLREGIDVRKASVFSKSAASKHDKIAGKSEFQEMVAKDEKYASYVKKDDVDVLVPKINKSRHKQKLSDDKNSAKAVAFDVDNGPEPRARARSRAGSMYWNADEPGQVKPLPVERDSADFAEARERARSRAGSMYLDPEKPGALLVERHSVEYVTDPKHKFGRPRPSIMHRFQPNEIEDEDEDDNGSTENLNYEKNNIPPNENKSTIPKISPRLEKKMSDPNALKRIYSRKHKKPYKQNRLTKQRAKALFGNNSRLAQAHFELLLRMFREASEEEKSRSVDSGPSNGPDLSWIQEYSDKDLLEDPDFVKMPSNYRRHLTTRMFSAFAPLWYAMILLGRMPFSGGIDIKTGLLQIELRRKSCRFVTFCLTSFIIFVVLTLSVISTYLSFNEFENGKELDRRQQLASKEAPRNDTIHPYTQLEILHLEKHWLPYTLLMLVFLFATICSIALIISGQHVAKMISEIVNTSVSFQIDASKWIWATCFGAHIVLGLGLVYKTVMCIWRFTVYENEVNGYLTMSSTRLFYKHIRTKFEVYPFVAPPFFVIQVYALYAAVVHILLPTVLVIAIDNVATHWNFRLGILLGKIKVTTSHLRWIKRQLNYEFMFRCHIIIRDMVSFYSTKAFSVILISWYCVMIAGFCCVLFRIARVAGVDFNHNSTNTAEFSNATVEHVNIKYADPSAYMFYDSGSFLIILAVGLLLVTEVMGKIGRTVMENGFGHLRRHGLMGCRSSHERRLIMSLYQCFSARHPCVISPGSLFTIDRRFIIAIIEMIVVLFTTMMQAQVNQLIQHEITGLCDTGVCVVGYAKTNARNNEFYTQNVQTVYNPGSTTLPGPRPPPPLVGPPPPTIVKPPPPTVIEPPPPTVIGPPLPPYIKPPPITILEPPPIIIIKPLPPTIVLPPTKPKPVILPAVPAILDPELNKNLYERCKGTDVVRQRIYTKKIEADGKSRYIPKPLPTTDLHCFINYYRSSSAKEEFYDALGEPLGDLSTFDSCGMPSLPKIKYLDPVGLTESDVVALKDRSKFYTKRIPVSTQGGKNNYECQEEENLAADKSLLPMVSTGKYDWAVKPKVCNLPSLFVDVYCQAWKESVDSGKTTVTLGSTLKARIAQVEGTISNLPALLGCQNPDEYSKNMAKLFSKKSDNYANEFALSFQLGINPTDLSKTQVWIRENYRALGTVTNQPTAVTDVDALSRNFGRLKKNLKAIFLPYTLEKNDFIYHCNGERIEIEYDDCGGLPFRIARDLDHDGKLEWVRPTLRPHKYKYYDPETKTTHEDTVQCWEHHLATYQCGVEFMHLGVHPDYYLYKRCTGFQAYFNPPGSTFSTEYITED